MLTKDSSVAESQVALGRVVKAQGLRGDLKVAVYSGDADDFSPHREVFVGAVDQAQPYTLACTRNQGKFAILSLAEIRDRSMAEAHVGEEVFVPLAQMPILDEDEFYWHEVIGLRVVTVQGRELGTVTSLIATGAYDVMVISSPGEHEYLVPYVHSFIVQQDTDAGILVIAPAEGLLEMNLPDAPV